MELDRLPESCQRVVLFHTGIGCHPCEEIEAKIKAGWAKKPSDVLVVPVDVGFDDDSLSAADDFANGRYKFTVPPLYEKDNETPSRDIMMRLWNYRLQLISERVKQGMSKAKAEAAVDAIDVEKLLQSMFDEMREAEISGLNKSLQWLQAKYDFFVKLGGSPGFYRENDQRDLSLRSSEGVPEIVVINKDGGRVINRPRTRDLLDVSVGGIWREIL